VLLTAQLTRWQCSRETSFLVALLATPISLAAMTETDFRQAQPLPAELASALRRATSQALAALLTLRIALRDHVHSERARGATLAEIDSELKEMVDFAGDSDGNAHPPERIAELRSYVLRLSDSFFSARPAIKKG